MFNVKKYQPHVCFFGNTVEIMFFLILIFFVKFFFYDFKLFLCANIKNNFKKIKIDLSYFIMVFSRKKYYLKNEISPIQNSWLLLLINTFPEY